MAETAASVLLNVIFEKLTDETFKKYVRSQGIHSELKNLGNELSLIQAVLSDASDKEIKDQAVKQWLIHLQHLAYDIDDILDDVATEAMHRELTQDSSGASTSMVRKLIPTCCTSMVRKLIPTCCTNISLSHRLAPKLDSITRELQHLYEAKFGLGLIVKAEKQKDPSRGNETSLLESDVVGREGEKHKLLKKLLGDDQSSKENFSIVPIVGMGGVGKTTLARLLYNDTNVQSYFELKAWVCVSDDFDIAKISNTILQSVTRENKKYEDLNQLQLALTEQFKEKRFLLVLDDVWTENYDDWEKLVRPLNSGAPGSRVIMTTRTQELLKRLGFNQLDHLESLSHEDAFLLFALHALGVDNFDSHATLKPKAEGIVKKCGGLPLALKAIGSLMRTKTDGEDWDAVLNSEIWDLENAKEIVPALRLSYHDLSDDLKQLFVYCSLFPKDFLFDKEELILLWMAQGYLDRPPTNKSPERLGREYYEKLLSRSFFQHAPNDKSLFVMHDLMNDLATFVAGEYFLRFDKQTEMTKEALAKYRHMSFIHEEYVTFQKFEAFGRARSLRTLLPVYVGVENLCNYVYISNKILLDLLSRLPLLRVLSLKCFQISEVPDFIGNLKHLRYFNLSQTKIIELPENVGNLYNLQTLIVFRCESLTTLPKSFLKLKNLRHFDIRHTPLLKRLPLGLGELKSLHTLSKVIIGGDDDFSITELKGLQNIHGKVSIEGLDEVKSPMHAREAGLPLKRVTELELKWGGGSRIGNFEMEVLNELKPHPDTLKHFCVERYRGIEFPCWVGDPSFHELVHVSLHGCRKCISLPPLGQLPSLKELVIKGMDEIKVIGLELTGNIGVAFPSLEVLRFEDMLGWKAWSASSAILDAVFPCLQELHITNCPKLSNVSLQALPLLGILEINVCSDGALRSLARAASLVTKLTICSILGLTDEVWRGVIKSLWAVKTLSIERCNTIKYLWESEAEASKVLGNLEELEVVSCSSFVSLGEEDEEDNLGSNLLSSLRVLKVECCGSMERCCCPNSIESLSIGECSSLTSVSFPKATGGGGLKLKSISISNCVNLIDKVTNTCMPMLEKLWINNWRNLKSIIQLSNFSLLTKMHISDCPYIESFPDLQLSNLTSLEISSCQNLKSFSFIQLSNLTSLEISSCQNLKSFPDLQLPNLTDFHISNCESVESFPDLQLMNLTNLVISACKRLESFPDLQLPNLTDLFISDCKSLESFPDLQLMNLTMLNTLQIECCPRMDPSFLCGFWPPSLVSLRIGGLKKPISEWGTHNFPTSLVDLRLRKEPHVRDFHQLSHILPSSLTHLYIGDFDKLESLSMGLHHLTSLQHLIIWTCPKMKHLPKVLLPSLLSLRIYGCPNLKDRCSGRGSHYWPLISHIPWIHIS